MRKQRRAKAEGDVDIRTVPGAGRDLTPTERQGGGGGGGKAPPSQGGTQPEAGKPPPQGIEGP